jgi:hypothetical protein
MEEEFKFLGHNMSYWLEVQKNIEKLDIVDYLKEIGDLRAKVSFYESRIDEMNKFKAKYN